MMSVYLSSEVGIVRRLYDRLRDVDELFTFSIGAEACDSRVLLGTACNRSNGGSGVTRRDAWLGGIGETVERYSAAFVPVEDLVQASQRELDDAGIDCLNPEVFTPFADWQLADDAMPFVRFTADLRLHWVESRHLANGSVVLLPAQLAYLDPSLVEANPIVYPTSNGLAYGCTTDEALVAGILELVERDGVMTTWYNRLSLPLVDLSSDRRLEQFLNRHVYPTGLDVSLVDLSAFTGVCALLAVVRNRHSDVAPIGLGAAASEDPLRCAVKAISEAVSTRGWAVIKQRDGTVVEPHSDWNETVKVFDDHISLYTQQAMVAETRFLDSSVERVGLGDLPRIDDATPATLREALVDRLTSAGVDLYAVDVTSPDICEGGGAVIRAFSPQLQPLDAGYRRRFLGGRRMRERPVELGLVSPELAGKYTDMPHPFP